jgi:hypothetical protein
MAVVAAASMFAHSREQGKLASSIYICDLRLYTVIISIF